MSSKLISLNYHLINICKHKLQLKTSSWHVAKCTSFTHYYNKSTSLDITYSNIHIFV